MNCPFREVTRAEVPQKWWDAERKPVPDSARELLGLPAGTEVSARVAIELPDYPICRAWMQWYHAQPLTDDTVPVTMTARDQWTARGDDLKAMFKKLLTEGKPTILPVIVYMAKEADGWPSR